MTVRGSASSPNADAFFAGAGSHESADLVGPITFAKGLWNDATNGHADRVLDELGIAGALSGLDLVSGGQVSTFARNYQFQRDMQAHGTAYAAGGATTDFFNATLNLGLGLLGPGKLAGSAPGESRVIFDTNAVISSKKAGALLNPGEVGVMTRTGAAELRNLVARAEGLFMPRAAGGMGVIKDAGSIDTRIMIRAALVARRPGAPGLFGDGSIGATVLATGLPFITADKALARILGEMGASDVRLLP